MNAAADAIDVVLLAAGLSRRMGDENKLLLPFCGQPLVRHTAATLVKTGFRRVLVVTGHDAASVEAAVAGLDVTVSSNPHFGLGQMASVVHGLRALAAQSDRSDGVLIALADMPYLQASDYRALARAFRQTGGEHIIVPQYLERRGNPIILPQNQVEAVANGDINTGCRKLIGDNPDRVRAFEVKNSAFVRDIDTAVDYGQALKAAYPVASCCG